MFSLGLYPLIDKSNRITGYSANLIDNIFTNEFSNNIFNGLLINDITDHLPVFAICKYRDIKRSSAPKYKHVRKTDDICVNAFKDSLLLVNWETITNEKDVNVAYAYFVDTFASLYNKNCPFKEMCIDDNNCPVKPWFTKGLHNACKKKNLKKCRRQI